MYTFGLFSLFACLPKHLGNQCLDNGKCEQFKVTGETPASDAPFEISRDDIKTETRVTNFQLTDRALLAQTETREACRALHLATRTYALTQEKWYHKPFKNYRLEEQLFVNGQYEPCSDWSMDEGVQLSVVYKDSDNNRSLYQLARSQSHVQLPFTTLGLGMLTNPTAPSVTVQVNNPSKDTLEVLLPERNGDWICETIPTIDRIVAKGDFNTWQILFNVGESLVPLNYIHDTEPRLLFHKTAIKGCSANNQRYLQGIIRAAANANPESYGHLNYLYSGLFGKRLSGVKRSSSANTGKQTSSKRSGSIVGTYQCKHNGQMAYMKIYRNGVFSLKLELESGSAQGVCKGKTCMIEAINSNAVKFTGGVNSFPVKRSGNALIMNKSIRCEKKS